MPRPRSVQQIQAEIDDVVERKNRITTDLRAIQARADDEVVRAGDEQKIERLLAGHDRATEEDNALRRELREAIQHDERLERLEAVRSAAGNARNVEDGDGARPARQTPAFVARNAVKNPWGVNGNYPAHGAELVRHALAAVEQADDGDHDHQIDRARYVRRISSTANRKDSEAMAQWALATSDPIYRSAFEKIFSNPIHGLQLLDHDEIRAFQRVEAVRAAMSLTDAAGGYMVPFTLDPNVILTNSGIADPIRSIANIKTIATDTWNGVSSAGVTAEWLGEGVEAADASPTFTQPVITPKKAAAWVFGSYEVLADSGFAGELVRLLADAKARLEGAAFATGNTGATRPRGLIAAVAAVTASIVTSATTNAFVAGDVYRTADALRPRDAARASWIANKRIYSLVRQMDTAGGSAFWANMGMGLPSHLLGQPQYEASTMSSVVTTGGNILLAGNFEQYVIVDRVGMTVLYEPMVKSTGNGRPSGQAGWYAFWRVGADVTDVDAFRLLQLNQVAAATALA